MQKTTETPIAANISRKHKTVTFKYPSGKEEVYGWEYFLEDVEEVSSTTQQWSDNQIEQWKNEKHLRVVESD